MLPVFIAFDDNSVVGQHVLSGHTRFHYIDNKVLHIHGELPGTAITGVDNENQIANKGWIQDDRFMQMLIKPAINRRAGRLVDDELIRLIDQSGIICIFGMSLGETDATWWKRIADWLIVGDRRLIIFTHKNESERPLTDIERFIQENRKRDDFMHVASVVPEKRQSVEDKIYVVETSLFNTNLVGMTELIKEYNRQAGVGTPATVEDFIDEYERQIKRTEIVNSQYNS